MKSLKLLALSAVLLSATSFAQVKPDDQIAFRKATFKFMSMNMAVVKANVEAKAMDTVSLKIASDALAVAFRTRPEQWFAEGTDKSSVHKVGALPEVWMKKDEFDKSMEKARKAAEGLVVAVQSGDKGKIGGAFGDLGKSCKACHDDFKAK